MEENISIVLNRRYKAYGTLIRSTTSNKRLVIFVHGFLGDQNHHLFYNAAQYFSSKGYSTFRYNLYGPQKDARKLNSTQFVILAKDLEKIITKLKKSYPDITLISHSLGAYTALLADLRAVKNLVFWEPSLHPRQMFNYTRKKAAFYIFNIGYQVQIPQKIINSMLGVPDISNLLRKIHKPIKIISAEKTGKATGALFFHLANSPKDFNIIKDSGHTFDTSRTESLLLNSTWRWLKNIKYTP